VALSIQSLHSFCARARESKVSSASSSCLVTAFGAASSVDDVFSLLLTFLVEDVKQRHDDEHHNENSHRNRRYPELLVNVSI
jgi:hypothetical protein